ncbi:MAG: GtrA family protein [Ruminococcaceae bacterium]|nr:GtrA family protein [Oscillospiraceae bacterium]
MLFLQINIARGEKVLNFKKFISKHKLFIDYVLWGTLTTVVSWVSFSLFSIILTIYIESSITAATVANIISWVCVVIFAFVTNKLWVFKSKSFNKKVLLPEFIKFFFSRFTTGIIEMVSLPFLMKIGINQSLFGIEGMASKILITLVVITINYILARLFVFKKFVNKAEKYR